METLLTGLYYFSAFVFVISIIVFVHEYGHYAVAKLSGVKIEVFSIGFGREIFGWNDPSGTRWKVSLLPFGGYVKMFGDVNAASVTDTSLKKKLTKKEQSQTFFGKSLPIKAAIVAAGPIANFVLSIVILSVFFALVGKVDTSPYVSKVVEGSAAERAGVQEQDLFLEIDGKQIGNFADVQRIVGVNVGTPMDVVFQREDARIEVQITPEMVDAEDAFGNPVQLPRLGVLSQPSSYIKLGVVGAIQESFVSTYHIASSTLIAIGQMITGKRGVKELSGPIGIAKYSGQSMERGWLTVMWFMAVLSVNLGLINLFPIPLLDGGHLLYYSIEAVRGKPMADKFQEVGFRIGMIFIVGLAIFAILNDIRKLGVFTW